MRAEFPKDCVCIIIVAEEISSTQFNIPAPALNSVWYLSWKLSRALSFRKRQALFSPPQALFTILTRRGQPVLSASVSFGNVINSIGGFFEFQRKHDFQLGYVSGSPCWCCYLRPSAIPSTRLKLGGVGCHLWSFFISYTWFLSHSIPNLLQSLVSCTFHHHLKVEPTSPNQVGSKNLKEKLSFISFSNVILCP